MSAKPGIRNFPAALRIFAPDGIETKLEGPTAMIFSLSMRTVSSGAAGAPVISITDTWVIARRELCGRLQELSKQIDATTRTRIAGTSLRFKRVSRVQAVVFLEDGSEFFVVDGDEAAIVVTSHGFGGDHGVDDGFFDCLDGRCENRIHLFVGQHFESNDTSGHVGTGVCSRECDKNVAGTVCRNAAVTANAKR